MKVYLVQHAEAKSKEEDPDRPLTDQGLSDIRKVAAFTAVNAPTPVNQIFHSGKTRAKQTADMLAETMKPPQGVSQSDDLGATTDPAKWANRLADQSDDVMLVGHMPHLDKLAGLLVCGDPEETVVDFQNGGVVCLTQDNGSWAVEWIVTPQIVP